MEKKTLRVYRETVFALAEEKKLTVRKLCLEAGLSESFLSVRFTRGGKGYTELSKLHAIALCSVLQCTETELTAIPMSAKKEREPKEGSGDLEGLIRDGFAMIHRDIRDLIETMDRYWKPEPKKYEVKKREQP